MENDHEVLVHSYYLDVLCKSRRVFFYPRGDYVLRIKGRGATCEPNTSSEDLLHDDKEK